MRRGVFATLMRPWYKILLRSLIGERHAMPNFRVCPCHSCDDGATARRTPLDYTFYVRSVVSFLVSMKTYYIATITYIATNVVPYRTRVSVNKIRTENNELSYMGVFPRRRASPRAARAPARCGVDQTFDPARFRLGWNRTVLSEPRRVRPLQGEGHVNSWSRIGRV